MKPGDYVFHPATADVGRVVSVGSALIEVDSAAHGGEQSVFAREWVTLDQVSDRAACDAAYWAYQSAIDCQLF